MKTLNRFLRLLLPVVLLGFQIQTLAVKAAGQDVKWETAGSEEAGFLIEFPGTPKAFSKTESGGRRAIRYELTTGASPDILLFRAQSFPIEEGTSLESLRESLVDSDAFMEEMARQLGAEVKKTWVYKMGIYPARSGRLVGKEQSSLVVVIVGKDHYFILMAQAGNDSSLDGPDVSRFLNSFDFYSEGAKKRDRGTLGGVAGPGKVTDTPFPPTAEWFEFEPEDRIFSLKFPGKPEISESENPAQGKVTHLRFREIRGGKVANYTLNYNLLKPETVKVIREGLIIQDNLSKSFSEKTGGEVLSSQVITIGGFPARRIVVYQKEKRILVLNIHVVTDTHYFNLLASSGLDKDEIEPRLDFYMKSLKLRAADKVSFRKDSRGYPELLLGINRP